MNKNQLSLYKLIILSTIGNLLKEFFSKENVKLPNRIGEYSFNGNIQKAGSIQSFLIGIYQNKKGQKAVAKMWYGKVKNFAYFTLKNEIVAYKILNCVFERVRKTMPERLKKMYVPKLIKIMETKKSLILFIEFVEGNFARELPEKEKINTYSTVVDFIGFLGENLTHKEKSFLSKRTPSNYIFLYPLLLIKAIITHPRATVHLLRGVPIFVKCIPALLKRSNKLVLVHRDLHLRNILVSKKRITLIDLQFIVFTELLHELVTTLRYRWNEDEFYINLLSLIKKRYSIQKDFKIIFQGLVINSATHGLTGGDFSKQKIDKFIDFLKFGSNPNIFKKNLKRKNPLKPALLSNYLINILKI